MNYPTLTRTAQTIKNARRLDLARLTIIEYLRKGERPLDAVKIGKIKWVDYNKLISEFHALVDDQTTDLVAERLRIVRHASSLLQELRDDQ